MYFPNLHHKNRAHTITVANESRPNFVICINFCPELDFPRFQAKPPILLLRRDQGEFSAPLKLHLFHIRLFLSFFLADVIAGYDRPHLPFLSLIKARTGWRAWIRHVDWGVAHLLCKLPSFSWTYWNYEYPSFWNTESFSRKNTKIVTANYQVIARGECATIMRIQNYLPSKLQPKKPMKNILVD